MKVGEKPVYYAGHGFDDEHDQKRPWLRIIILLGLAIITIPGLIWLYNVRQPANGIIQIEISSDPTGAEILLDYTAIGKSTPYILEVDPEENVLLQVVIPNMESDPLAVRVDQDFSRRHIHFTLMDVTPQVALLAKVAINSSEELSQTTQLQNPLLENFEQPIIEKKPARAENLAKIDNVPFITELNIKEN